VWHIEPRGLTLCAMPISVVMATNNIFTTELFEGTPPAPSHWWYYSFETGQHIAFFQRRAL